MQKSHRMKPKRQIHKKLKKHIPKGVHKAKKLFSLKYPKLFLIVIFILLAYYIFSQKQVLDFVSNLDQLSYFGIFIAGIFLAFGFSAPFSVGFFIVAQPNNLFLATLIGGIGAMVGDMIIFKTIKFSFMDEFEKLKRIKIIKYIRKISIKNKHLLIKHYLLYVFAGILIATPLPDEVGVSMLAGLTNINPKKLAVISFILHSTAIFLILYFSIIL
jgi:uncharacterized membrane protein YdjX (TVP38/TMEM64 family)